MDQATPTNSSRAIQGGSEQNNANLPSSSKSPTTVVQLLKPLHSPKSEPPQLKKKNSAKQAKSPQKASIPTKSQPNDGNAKGNKTKEKQEQDSKNMTTRKKIGEFRHKPSAASGNSKRQSTGKPASDWRTVGKMRFNFNDVLGKGCDGTRVFRGEFDDGEVAVKRVYKNRTEVDREKMLLKASDFHCNVIRYYYTESNEEFRYLILELCVASLYEYVEIQAIRESLNIPAKEILRQSTEGLAHLHAINIFHRDLKPQNILFHKSESGKITMKLSDFGTGKKVDDERISFTVTNGLVGTTGWWAPEILNNTRTTGSIDIFSLGCIFYYVLTGGSHPFGTSIHRNSNIIKGEYSLEGLAKEEHRLSYHLVDLAISFSPIQRPSAEAMINHPFFWNFQKQLDFFGYASDKLNKETSPTSIIMERLEKNEANVIKINWTNEITPLVMTDLLKFRDYNESSVRGLLRAIRNLKSHYGDRTTAVQEALGQYPGGLVTFFTSRFPELLLHVYIAMEWCCEDSFFVSFYSDETRIRIKKEHEELQKKLAEEKAAKKKEKKQSASTLAPTPISPTIPEEEEQLLTQEVISEIPSSPNVITTIESSDITTLQSDMKNTTLVDEIVTVLEQPKQMEAIVTNIEDEKTTVVPAENWVGKLYEFCAQNKLPAPVYSVYGTQEGFAAHVTVGTIKASGSAKKKQEAKADAARILYQIIPTHGMWVGKLAEFCVKNKLPEPRYTKPIEETGPDKVKTFTALGTVATIEVTGRGKSKKEAKADAARKLLEIVQKQVVALRKASDQLEGKTVNNEVGEEIEEPFEGILADPAVDVARAHTETNPQEAIKTILSDTSRFLSNSIVYRDVEEPNSRGRTQADLTIEYHRIEEDREYTHVSGGEGMDVNTARDEAARAALVHLLTYEQ